MNASGGQAAEAYVAAIVGRVTEIRSGSSGNTRWAAST
jgi:hypothetical protein